MLFQFQSLLKIVLFTSLLLAHSSRALHRTSSNTGGSLSTNFSRNMAAAAGKYPIYCDADVMSGKSHGTCEKLVMKNLRWNVDWDTADRICCFNRHYAEYSGYWETTTFLEQIAKDEDKPITFYDSVYHKPLFRAPVGRTWKQFLAESKIHGWPSFRDEEVVWENVRCLQNGEAVSLGGTHLGHNLPDKKGNRYCINLVSVAGVPEQGEP